MEELERIDRDFKQAQDETDDATAAAIITLAKVLGRINDSLDHNICMGLRMGLFGSNADNNVSIKRA